MGISLRHAIFLIAAIVSLVWAWMHGIAWVAGGGNLLNLPSFFIEAYHSGSAAAFLTIDILFAWGVLIVWVIGDARRIGLGTRTGVVFALLSLLGTCFAFPLYLIRRERWLDRKDVAQ
ncbi:MAG: DUF2834 domain-containing protein [Sphingomonadales bacterium]|nr:DUF2834 domain-containing protein [Sphingomonadales bacterium]